MELVVISLQEIHPYESNPRINDGAVSTVAESIRQCGYIAPIIVDEDGVILAGHTRYKALQKLGYAECQVAVVAGLTEEQKRKYRILDNKTGEIAAWDFDLLLKEIGDIDFEGFDFGFAFPDNEALDLDNSSDAEEEQGETAHCPKCGFTFRL